MTTAAPFVRFSRDKRGYEHFYLVHSSTNRRGKTHARILYWFRTPPGVKVGRSPFSDEVQRALEMQNPGVAFDWKRLAATPIPPPAPDVERWRERRRLEKAEKAARRALLAADEESPAEEGDELPQLAEASGSEVAETAGPEQVAAPTDPVAATPPARKRRRRRRGRRDRSAETAPANSTPPTSNPED